MDRTQTDNIYGYKLALAEMDFQSRQKTKTVLKFKPYSKKFLTRHIHDLHNKHGQPKFFQAARSL